MGKKITPKFPAYLYQWTHYVEDFDLVRNLRRKGGNSQAGERLAFVNSCLEASDPKPHWLVCGQFKGGEFKVYALCKLRAPSEAEKRFHDDELAAREQAFEKYVYVDEEKSFIVALPKEEGVFDHHLDKLLQVEIGKRNGQLQGSNGLAIQIDDFYIERLKRRQLMTFADRIRQLGDDGLTGVEPDVHVPLPSSVASAGTDGTESDESLDPDAKGTLGDGGVSERVSELDEIAKGIDEECANFEGQDVDAIAKRRVGQGIFRTLLLERFDGACCMTGLKNVRLLIASHIVPWSKSTPTQKLAPDNGLLLSVSMDALFDKGLISFSDDGSILMGDDLDSKTIEILGLEKEFVLPEKLMTAARKENLTKHRELHGFKTAL